MGCTINPNEGILEINGKNINLSCYEEMVLIKSQAIGFVFHQHNLLEAINAEENVAFPLKVQNLKSDEIRERTTEALKRVDMDESRKKMPKQLRNWKTANSYRQSFDHQSTNYGLRQTHRTFGQTKRSF